MVQTIHAYLIKSVTVSLAVQSEGGSGHGEAGSRHGCC